MNQKAGLRGHMPPNRNGNRPAAAAAGGGGGIPRAVPADPTLRSFIMADFEAAERPEQRDGVEHCGELLLNERGRHGFLCKTVSDRCLCERENGDGGVYMLPTVSLLGAQKGGSTAMLAYMMQNTNYRNAVAKEIHILDRSEALREKGLPGFLDAFDMAYPEKFQDEQLGWTTPSLLYALPAPVNVKKIVPRAKFIVVLRNPIDRAMSEYYMEYRRVEKQNEYIEKLMPLLPAMMGCVQDEPQRARRSRRSGPGGGEPPSACIDRSNPVFRDDGFHTFLLNNALSSYRAHELADCLAAVDLDAEDTSIGSLSYVAAKTCFATITHIFIEELPSIRDDFMDEMEDLEKCSYLASDGTKMLKVGETGCFRRGATSSLMEGNFLLRSVYSSQIRLWFESFDPSQFLFVSADDLHSDPQKVMDQVADFIEIERQTLDTSIDMHEYINKKFPGFEEATGWSMAAHYPPLDPDLRSKLGDFFQPFMDDTSVLIGWDSINWK